MRADGRRQTNASGVCADRADGTSPLPHTASIFSSLRQRERPTARSATGRETTPRSRTALRRLPIDLFPPVKQQEGDQKVEIVGAESCEERGEARNRRVELLGGLQDTYVRQEPANKVMSESRTYRRVESTLERPRRALEELAPGVDGPVWDDEVRRTAVQRRRCAVLVAQGVGGGVDALVKGRDDEAGRGEERRERVAGGQDVAEDVASPVVGDVGRERSIELLVRRR